MVTKFFEWLGRGANRHTLITVLSIVGLIILFAVSTNHSHIKNEVEMPGYLIPDTFGGSFYSSQLGDGQSDWAMECPVCKVPGEIKIFYYKVDGRETHSVLYSTTWIQGGYTFGYTQIFEEGVCYPTAVGSFLFEVKYLETTSYGEKWEMKTSDC